MLGFTITRKKKDEEPESNEEENKVSRKKKKEAPKPWGKFERLLILGILVATVGGSTILALSARSWKLSGISFKLLPGFSFHKTYVLEKPTNEDFSIPIEEFKQLTKDKTGVYGFFVTRVYRDSSYGWQEHEEFNSNSLVQMGLLWDIYYRQMQGDFSLSKQYVVKREDRLGNSALKPLAVGSSVDYGQLVSYLCTSADQASEKIFLNALGLETVQSEVAKQTSGFTNIENHTTTPSDIGFLLKKVVELGNLDSASQEKFVDCLRKNESPEFVLLGGSQFVYKYDLSTRQASVAGIVFSPKPFVIVVVGEGIIEEEAQEILPAAFQIISDFEN